MSLGTRTTAKLRGSDENNNRSCVKRHFYASLPIIAAKTKSDKLIFVIGIIFSSSGIISSTLTITESRRRRKMITKISLCVRKTDYQVPANGMMVVRTLIIEVVMRYFCAPLPTIITAKTNKSDKLIFVIGS